jgi:hypothetical protein
LASRKEKQEEKEMTVLQSEKIQQQSETIGYYKGKFAEKCIELERLQEDFNKLVAEHEENN